MENTLFDEFLASVKEGKKILQGKSKPARSFKFKKRNIAEVRKKHNMSQTQLAQLVKVPVATIRNWEQGRTAPDATGQTLLRVVDEYPEMMVKLAKKPRVVYQAATKSK